jgi:hypothetical protein
LDWLLDVLNSGKLSAAHKTAATASAVRLAYKYRKTMVLKQLENSDDRIVATVYSRMFVREDVSLRQLLSDTEPAVVGWPDLVRELATAKDLPLLKRTLRKSERYRHPDALVLAICDYGGEAEFDFLFETFHRYKGHLEFSESREVLTAIAGLAGRRHLSMMEEIIESETFHTRGEYSGPFKLSDTDNIYFIKWIVGVTFAHLAGRKQINLLRHILSHHYWTVRNAAAEALVRLCEASDLAAIIDDMLISKDDQDAFMKVLREMDEQLYMV